MAVAINYATVQSVAEIMDMMTGSKSNIHKKITYEDHFSRRFACWVRNNPKAWRFWKRRNRKLFRKVKTDEVD